MKDIKITRKTDLGLLDDYLHNSTFTLNQIIFNKKKEIITIPFDYSNFEKVEDVKSGFFGDKYKIPQEKWLMIISKVRNFDIQSNKEETWGIFDKAEYREPDTLILTSIMPIKFTMAVRKLDVQLKNTGITAGYRKGITRRLFGMVLYESDLLWTNRKKMRK